MRNEGYSNITIPEVHIRTCSGCKYHSHRMVKSGNDPIYADNCNHPDLDRDGASFSLLLMEGNLTTKERGYVVTPDWCPILIKARQGKADDKG